MRSSLDVPKRQVDSQYASVVRSLHKSAFASIELENLNPHLVPDCIEQMFSGKNMIPPFCVARQHSLVKQSSGKEIDAIYCSVLYWHLAAWDARYPG